MIFVPRGHRLAAHYVVELPLLSRNLLHETRENWISLVVLAAEGCGTNRTRPNHKKPWEYNPKHKQMSGGGGGKKKDYCSCISTNFTSWFLFGFSRLQIVKEIRLVDFLFRTGLTIQLFVWSKTPADGGVI